MEGRRGARSLAAVPEDVRAALSDGTIESVNLMEWLATDMAALAQAVGARNAHTASGRAIRDIGISVRGLKITKGLAIIGSAVRASMSSNDPSEIEWIATHRSDIVRQWACYALADPRRSITIHERLSDSLRFARDPNMSVREVAWIAFRPYVRLDPIDAIALLEPICESNDPNERRFAVEVTRPRSVWGAHVPLLKQKPEIAEGLLNRVRSDSARYVQLAVGNWLNDASRTRPDWVRRITDEWALRPNEYTARIANRGLRTIRSLEKLPAEDRATDPGPRSSEGTSCE